MKISYLYIVILLFFQYSNVWTQTIQVYADTDSTEYLIGDHIIYTLEITHDKSITVILPSIPDSIRTLDYITEGRSFSQERNNQFLKVKEFIFSKFDSGTVTIPTYKIQYRVGTDENLSHILVNPIEIRVKTIDVDLSGDIQDVKSPLKIEFNWFMVVVIILILILILLGIYIGYKYYIKKRKGEVKIKKILRLPPFKIALDSLNSLKEKKLWQQGKVKEYHSEITGIIRRYFEDRFNFLALEMPSSDVLRNLNMNNEGKEIFDITNEFLKNADLVKFAKFKPIPTINENMMNQAYEIINKTKIEEETKVETVEVKNAG
ncbi:hypothetical protein ACFLS9_08350 [Bacteroidota bacterium]